MVAAATAAVAVKYPAAVLGVVALVVLSLAWGVGRYFAEDIAAHRAAYQQRALADLLRAVDYDNAPAAEAVTLSVTAADVRLRGLFVARRSSRVVAVVLRAAAADGYNGEIEFLARWDSADDERPQLRVLRHRETPGIAGFVDDDLTRAADGVSGATISARAVADATEAAAAWLRRCLDWAGGEIVC